MLGNSWYSHCECNQSVLEIFLFLITKIKFSKEKKWTKSGVSFMILPCREMTFKTGLRIDDADCLCLPSSNICDGVACCGGPQIPNLPRCDTAVTDNKFCLLYMAPCKATENKLSFWMEHLLYEVWEELMKEFTWPPPCPVQQLRNTCQNLSTMQIFFQLQAILRSTGEMRW